MKNVNYNKKIITKKPQIVFAGFLSFEGSLGPLNKGINIIFINEGIGRIEFNNNNYPIKKGALIAINPQADINICFSEQGSAYIITLDELKIDQLPENNIVRDNFFMEFTHQDCFSLLENIFISIIYELDNLMPLNGNISELLVNFILLRIIRSSGVCYLGKASQFLKAKEYLDQNFTKIIIIEELCKHLNINKFYLTKLFNENTGMPPAKYLIKKRIDYSKILLKDTNKSIDEISKECGYSEVSYFSALFKLNEGTSPLSYRKKSRSL